MTPWDPFAHPWDRDPAMPTIKDLVLGRVYKVYCRNLHLGVFDGKDGFIGIREKFGRRYLFTEHHWDCEAFGTVRGVVDLNIDVPRSIAAAIESDRYFKSTSLFVLLEQLEIEHPTKTETWIDYVHGQRGPKPDGNETP